MQRRNSLLTRIMASVDNPNERGERLDDLEAVFDGQACGERFVDASAEIPPLRAVAKLCPHRNLDGVDKLDRAGTLDQHCPEARGPAIITDWDAAFVRPRRPFGAPRRDDISGSDRVRARRANRVSRINRGALQAQRPKRVHICLAWRRIVVDCDGNNRIR
jgi:hypothetical protein